MAKQTINIGTSPNDGTGDALRTGAGKINANFTELYDSVAAKADATSTTSALAGKVATTAIDIDSTMAANSDSNIASQKAVKTALAAKADASALTSGLAGKVDTSAIDTDASFTANSDAKIPSQKAVKAYVDANAGGGGGAWTAYTPTLSAHTGSFTTASASGRYKKIGRTVFFSVSIHITTNGTAVNYVRTSLPFACQVDGVFAARETASVGVMCQAYAPEGTTTLILWDTAGNYPGGDGRTLIVSGSYEATA